MLQNSECATLISAVQEQEDKDTTNWRKTIFAPFVSDFKAFRLAMQEEDNFLQKCDEGLDAEDVDDLKMALLHEKCVGFDLVGDELGYPYCPFVLDEFLDLGRSQK